ncbi:hypothetical protein LJE06_13220 [Bilophila wadsworthia]|uniref:hypothetical protein n=1 Tax=Bilophila wadsworthia TaxID=35833 RepID=UPI001D09EAFE|nr:hypothetical protein [Bilophila wadsworthia]MCB8572052.1 hypothetical protein [Bilophila wadsworthia]
MRELITPQEMAERLSVEYGTFRRTNWRNYPHIFIGKGRTLRSVRFMWESDLSHLRIEVKNGDQSIYEERSENVPSEIQIQRDSILQVGLHLEGSRSGMDSQRAKENKGTRRKESHRGKQNSRFNVLRGLH